MKKAAFFAFVSTLLAGCGAFTEHRVGRIQDRLTACPAWPRCVSSFENSQRHGIAPLALTAEAARAWSAARLAVASMERTRIVDEQADYLRAEITSPWHFYTDDLELLLRVEQKEIAVRSTGRIGYYDFEVNRDRVEALRAALCQASMVACRDGASSE